MGIPHVQPHALAAAIEQMAISGMLNLDGTVAVLDPAKNLSATELPATLLYLYIYIKYWKLLNAVESLDRGHTVLIQSCNGFDPCHGTFRSASWQLATGPEPL